MKPATQYAEYYFARKRGAGISGQVCEFTRVATLPEVIRQAQIDALRFCLMQTGEAYDELIATKLAELEAETARPVGDAGGGT